MSQPTAANATMSNPLTFRPPLPLLLFLLLVVLLLTTTTPPTKPFYHSLFLSLSSNATASRHLRSLTLRPHPASSAANAAAAAYVAATLSSYSIPTRSSTYQTLLSFPVHRSLSLRPSPDRPLLYFDLTQNPYSLPAEAASAVLPSFHAYAASGTAVAELVYVNYGRDEDYLTLRRMGVGVGGKVVLARYGKIYRGDIVRNAEMEGAVGVVVYTDRADYGGGGKEGEAWFPEGRWMPPSGVQVGTVYRGLGDPTTPGWASTPEAERVAWEDVVRMGDVVPRIPSIPVSFEVGEALHRSIGGDVASADWQGGDGSRLYHVGPGPGIVNLTYEGKQEVVTIENVYGVIEGEEEPDRYVLIGNHRDAWTFGAVDPNSGTTMLLELAERLYKLQKKGWRPRRTIILCNWDAEEYGLIGSTEFVEENREVLSSRVVAYLNVDCVVAGPGFQASSTPQLDDLLKDASKYVRDPDNSSQMLYESWMTSAPSPKIGRLGGGGSDYASFVQHLGIPSADMLFGKGYPVYHSMYDDFTWMQKFGDPTFQRHVAAASIVGLVALRLADEEFLPFNYYSYASELQLSTRELEDSLSETAINVNPLYKSIEELRKAAANINKEVEELKGNVWLSNRRHNFLKVRELNDRLMMAERAFTDAGGLTGRSWYKHLIYGPSEHDDYGSDSFPGVSSAIENAKSSNTIDSWKVVQHEVLRVARCITQASMVLKGKFL